MKLEEEIKKLFKEEPNKALYPIDNKMKFLESLGIVGMSSENIRYVINYLVKNYAKTYLEVGNSGCGWPDHTSRPKWWNGLRLFYRGI
jgi:hypothetical protein